MASASGLSQGWVGMLGAHAFPLEQLLLNPPCPAWSPDIVRSVLSFYVKASNFCLRATYSRKEENVMYRLLKPVLYQCPQPAVSEIAWNRKKERGLVEVKGQTGNNKYMITPTSQANGREKHSMVHTIHGEHSTIRSGPHPKHASRL